jgi:hypothetical protein
MLAACIDQDMCAGLQLSCAVAWETGFIGLDSVFQWLKTAVLRTAYSCAVGLEKKESLTKSACSWYCVTEFVDMNSLDYRNKPS